MAQGTSLLTGVQVPSSQTDQAAGSVVQISTIDAFFGVAAVLIGVGIAWGTLKNGLKTVAETLKNNVVPDLKDVRERFMVVEDRVETLWRDKLAPSQSPRKLNERGLSILQESGIKEIVDEKLEKLLALVKTENPTTAYDAEREILAVMLGLREHCPEIVDRLKDGAFKSGVDIDALLFVGGIYLRDQIFPKLGFSLDDLDKPKS